MVPRLHYAHHVGGRPLERADPAERTRARTIVTRLAKAYPDWGPTLDFTTPLELLVATILAAQARDERVNEVTRPLFKKYRTPRDWLGAPARVLEGEIKPTGFFRQKTKAVQGACRGIVERFGGKVPATMDELVSLHGVGRKTASIVLGGAFAVPSIAVDRHVVRVAGRLGLTRSSDPEVIEEDLRTLLPKAQWVKATWTLVLHGRRTCRSVPECPACPVVGLCPYPKKTLPAKASPAAGPTGAAARRRAPTAPPRRGARRPAEG